MAFADLSSEDFASFKVPLADNQPRGRDAADCDALLHGPRRREAAVGHRLRFKGKEKAPSTLTWPGFARGRGLGHLATRVGCHFRPLEDRTSMPFARLDLLKWQQPNLAGSPLRLTILVQRLDEVIGQRNPGSGRDWRTGIFLVGMLRF
jgi:hypothetical protein